MVDWKSIHLVRHPRSKSPTVSSAIVGAASEAVSKVVALETSCYDARVAGTLYVPVPKAQEVYSLAGLSGNEDLSRISAQINLLSLRDPDV